MTRDDGDSMSEPKAIEKRRIQSSIGWGVAWALMVGALLIAVVVFRMQAVDSDHAKANLATYVGLLCIWITTVVCLFGSRRHRATVGILIGPIVCGLLFMAAFRMERVDGELIPHFAFRWKSPTALPKLDSSSADDQRVLFEPRSTDWPQLLGQNRDSHLQRISIETDWQSRPPKLLWKQAIGEGWSGVSVRGDVGITMEQRDQEEWVSAYDLRDGSLVWKHAIACRHFDSLGGLGPRSTPAISGDRVYACSAVTEVVCLELKTGSLVWSKDLDQLANVNHKELEEDLLYGRSGSPLVLESTVVVPLGGSQKASCSLIALDLQTGEERWRAGDKQISFASPQLAELAGVPQIIYPTKKNLLSLDPASGRELWSLSYEGSGEAPNVAQPITLDANTLFISKGYGVGARIVTVNCNGVTTDAQQAKWEATVLKENRTVLRTKFTSPVLHNGHVYGLSDGILECVDVSTLKRKWKQGRYHHGHVLLLENCLLVSAEDGRAVLVASDPNQYRELAQLEVIGGVTWNPPTVSGNRLILRNSSELACLELNALP